MPAINGPSLLYIHPLAHIYELFHLPKIIAFTPICENLSSHCSRFSSAFTLSDNTLTRQEILLMWFPTLPGYTNDYTTDGKYILFPQDSCL